MAIGTSIDIWQQVNPYPILATDANQSNQDNFLVAMFKCFSIYINGKQVLKTEMGKGAITCLSGMRFISMAWIVLGHLYMYAQFYTKENPREVEKVKWLSTYVGSLIGNACTVWKFKDFYATRILCKINFAHFEAPSKTAILTIWAALILKIWHF